MKTLEEVVEKINQMRDVINAHSDTIKKHKIELLEQQIIGIKMKLETNNTKSSSDIFGDIFGG